jgi:hypothetical protein
VDLARPAWLDRITFSLGLSNAEPETDARERAFFTRTFAVLESDHWAGVPNRINGDEFWFFLWSHRDSMITQSRNKVPKRISNKGHKRCML